MAGQWDQLPMDQKRAIMNVALQGQKKTPENYNRINEQLHANPELVAQFAADAGVDLGNDGQVQDGTESSDSARIDRYVDKGLQTSGSNDVPGEIQTTGNGQLEDRVRMLEQALSQRSGPDVRGMPPVDQPPDSPDAVMRAQMMMNQQGGRMRGPVRRP
jgi:hypothetical protein